MAARLDDARTAIGSGIQRIDLIEDISKFELHAGGFNDQMKFGSGRSRVFFEWTSFGVK
jgi:hypothetical protein